MTYDARASGCNCDACPLKGSTVVPPKGPPDADLVIIAETPGYWEEKKGEPLVGPSGVMLNDILYRAEIKRERCFLTNTILCRPYVPDEAVPRNKRYDFKTFMAWLRKENAKRKKARAAAIKSGRYDGVFASAKEEFEPIASPIDCCAPRLWQELGWFEQKARDRGLPNGAIVIPLGNFALKALTGHEGIAKYRGSPLIVNLQDPFMDQGSALKAVAEDRLPVVHSKSGGSSK